MRFYVLILFLILEFLQPALAQQNTVTFQAKDLQLISQRYTGAQSNWPLVVDLAVHNAEDNSFTLSSADVLRLQNFASLSNQVSQQQKKIQQLISDGATIFAPEKLSRADSITTEYKNSVQNGTLEQASQSASILPAAVDDLEKTLLANRLVDVQAQITKKDGEVDKRRGLLGSWEDAFKGDLLKELDGLRTLIESYANLSFTDGSTIIVEPNTEAVIRKSRIDKLDESSDTEITLENGSLLAKLSSSGKVKSKYILNAGPSMSELKSQNFYAEAEGTQIAKLTNYDGLAIVSANDMTITIQKNEGTIVEEGKDPLPPIKLLPAPGIAWSTQDTVIYRDNILFPYTEVENAVEYRVQYSASPNFDGEVKTINTTQTSVDLQELPLGITYVRVQASDNLGLKGPHSETIRIIRNIDNKPPALFIDNTRNDLLFTLNDAVTITGVTEPNASLKAGEANVSLSGSGQFSIEKSNLEYDQSISFRSVDNSGNETLKNLRIIQLTEDILYNLNFQGASGVDPVIAQKNEVTISGTAYPGLEVELSLMNFQKSVKTDSRGRWGLSFNPVAGKLTITFKNAYSGQTYLTKSYSIQLN